SHLVLEILRRRHARHVDAVSGYVELPAVIDAAQAALLVAAEKQRCATVRAAVVEHPNAPGAIPERDQFLPEKHQAHWRPVGRERGRQCCRDTVPAYEPAHHGSGTEAGELDAFPRRGHGAPECASSECWVADATTGPGHAPVFPRPERGGAQNPPRASP